jgi:hypothetical protein
MVDAGDGGARCDHPALLDHARRSARRGGRPACARRGERGQLLSRRPPEVHNLEIDKAFRRVVRISGPAAAMGDAQGAELARCAGPKFECLDARQRAVQSAHDGEFPALAAHRQGLFKVAKAVLQLLARLSERVFARRGKRRCGHERACVILRLVRGAGPALIKEDAGGYLVARRNDVGGYLVRGGRVGGGFGSRAIRPVDRLRNGCGRQSHRRCEGDAKQAVARAHSGRHAS